MAASVDEQISAFYEELVRTTMTPGSRQYLAEKHKADFTHSVNAAVDYGVEHGVDALRADPEVIWSIPFYLWGGSCDEKSEDEGRIEQFVYKLIQK